MDPDVLAQLDEYIVGALADSVAPGAAIAVGRRGRLVRLRGYGRLDWTSDSPGVTPFSLYDLASLTKVVGTTSAIMILVEEGMLGLDDLVVQHLPEFSRGDERKSQVTIRDLLLHRSGLPATRRFFEELAGLDAVKDAVYETPLEADPGSGSVYSDLGFMTLGWVVEAVSSEPLDAFLERRVFGPLGMVDTQYNPDISEIDRTAPTERGTSYRPELIVGEAHDENAHAMGGVAGHAGLFSTAQDLSVLTALLANDGMLEACAFVVGSGIPCGARSAPIRVRFLEEGTVRRFSVRASSESSRALGWDTPSGRSSSGDFFSARSYGHTGFTGTSIWIDPELDLFVVLLTNRVNPTRANTRHIAFRRRVHDMAADAVTDREVPPRDLP
jgi:CubicO group peptidase (beta-lactamase class C family)